MFKNQQQYTTTYILEWLNPNAGMDVEQEEASFTGNMKAKCYHHYGGHFGNFLQY